MLPFQPSLAPLRRPLLALALVLLLALPAGLSGCSLLRSQPSQGVLLDALALQINLTQGAIARALGLEATGLPEVSRVRVEHQEPVTIGAARGLHLSGRFDWRLAGDPIRVDSPFELWLQQGERGESWRLAMPDAAGDVGLDGALAASAGAAAGAEAAGAEGPSIGVRNQPGWTTHPLPLPGERRRA